MTQYHLPMGSKPAQRTFAELDSFTQGYIEAMFFTDASDPDDGELADATFADLAPETLADIQNDCTAFQVNCAKRLDAAYALAVDGCGYSPERAGHDFWLTRNGHGAGFWDRDGLGALGDKLTVASKAWGECYVYLGDDEKVHIG